MRELAGIASACYKDLHTRALSRRMTLISCWMSALALSSYMKARLLQMALQWKFSATRNCWIVTIWSNRYVCKVALYVHQVPSPVSNNPRQTSIPTLGVPEFLDLESVHSLSVLVPTRLGPKLPILTPLLKSLELTTVCYACRWVNEFRLSGAKTHQIRQCYLIVLIKSKNHEYMLFIMAAILSEFCFFSEIATMQSRAQYRTRRAENEKRPIIILA